jgi:glutaredoxin
LRSNASQKRPRRGAFTREHFPASRESASRLQKVTVYTAEGCHLCARALEVVEDARSELAFELEVVNIEGNPALEERHREHLPVVEIDGVRAFTYFVDPTALRERLTASS